MHGRSIEGLTLAYIFDAIIILLVIIGPFLLPWAAKFGAKARLSSGIIAITLGVFLGAITYASSILDGDKHWLLRSAFEFVVMALTMIPLGVLFFIVLPFIFVFLGIWILSRGKRGRLG